jgi:hypothetical protein
MNRLLFLIVFLLITLFSNSQEYFNIRFDFNQQGWFDGASNLFVLPDAYIAGGGSVYYDNNLRLCFNKFDFQGNKISSSVYCDTLANYYLGNPGSIIQITEDSIIAVGTKKEYTSTWVHDQGNLLFLNYNFDTLMTKQFGEKSEPFDTSYIFFQAKICGSDNIIIAGIKWALVGSQKILLLKTDLKGNLLWEKTFGYGAYFQGQSVICTSDNGFAIGGYTFDFVPPPNLTGDPVVYKTDSSGNFLWSFNYGTPYIDTQGMLCSTQDGNMVLGFGYCDSMSGGGGHNEGAPFRRINLIKIDNNGSTIWDRKYGASEYEKELTNVRENPDGTLIVSGKTHHSKYYTSKDYGWLLKTNSEGDSLWYREYIASDGEETDHWLYDVIETPDKGYLTCGVVYPMPPDTGSQDGWILKVDSLGCERVDYCWVGMKEEPPLTANEEIKIFPNPAKGEARFDLRFTTYDFRIEICLYDLFGREVKKIPLSQGQTDLMMDVSDLTPGLYVAVLKSDNRIIARKKLVKQKECLGEP